MITPRRHGIPLRPVKTRAAFTVLAVLLALTAGNARASQSSGTDFRKPYALIFGTVWGPDDHPLYGVKVRIRRADQKKAKWELYSDHQGEFAQRVPAGKAEYLVWPDLKGFKSLTEKPLQPCPAVSVHVEYDERADVGLHLKYEVAGR
ncbi:MAG TPA: hypothetical protein VEI01_08355 [Terriglobales bacterium]|nr:hypothetical protein [Terriglobales bacterium]